MGDFSIAFNRMTQQLKDSYQELERRNEFIRKVFGRYTSDEVVEALLDAPDGLKLGGEKREVTILMSDLRGLHRAGRAAGGHGGGFAAQPLPLGHGGGDHTRTGHDR